MLRHLQSYADRGMALDHMDRLFERIAAKTPVLYIHDNVGEIALDLLFIQEIRRHGCRVTWACAAARSPRTPPWKTVGPSVWTALWTG